MSAALNWGREDVGIYFIDLSTQRVPTRRLNP